MKASRFAPENLQRTRFESAVVSVLALISALILTSCGGAKDLSVEVSRELPTPIVGGQLVPRNSLIAESTVFLIQPKGTCTATLLNSRWLVTAAHCLYGFDPKDLRIQIPSPQGGKSLAFQPKSLHVAPGYAKVLKFIEEKNIEFNETGRRFQLSDYDVIQNWGDIGLVELATDAPSSIAPARLQTRFHALTKNQIVTLAGFGIDRPASKRGAGRLRETSVVVSIPNWGGTEFLVNEQFSGACYGDSGGPAFINEGGELVLVGVTSRLVADVHNRCNGLAAFTYLGSYLRWIQYTIAQAV